MVTVHTSSPPTVHTAYTSSVSVTVLSAILRVWVWILETQVGLSLVWKNTWKEKEDTVDCRSRKPSFLNAKYLSIVTSHTHCVYKPGALPSATWKTKASCPSPGTNFACVGTSSPRFLPASDSEWLHHLSQRRRRGQTSRCLSMRLRASYSYLGNIGGRNENTDGTAPAFGKCPAFPGFKQLVMDPGRVHKLLGTSMKANFFFGRKCSMHQTVLLGTRKFDQSAWRMANNQRFLSSLDRGKLWEKSKGLALPRLEQQGTPQWSLNDIPKQKKNESSNEKHTHIAADSRRRCPEPRSRAIIVQMVHSTNRAKGRNTHVSETWPNQNGVVFDWCDARATSAMYGLHDFFAYRLALNINGWFFRYIIWLGHWPVSFFFCYLSVGDLQQAQRPAIRSGDGCHPSEATVCYTSVEHHLPSRQQAFVYAQA